MPSVTVEHLGGLTARSDQPSDRAYRVAVDVVVASAVRTPFCRRNGALRGWHAVELLSFVIDAAVERMNLEPAQVSHVIAACATPVGEQAWNIGRSAVLGLGWPEAVSASTVDAQAVSGQVAVHNAVAMVQSGMAQVVVAAGVESSTRVPAGASIGVAVGKPFGPAVHERYVELGGLVPPGVVAENMAARAGLSRADLDAYALGSHDRARSAQNSGALKAEIQAVAIRNDRGIDTASSIEHDELGDAALIASVTDAFVPGGSITASNLAAPGDGAAAVVVVSAAIAKNLKITPLATVAGAAVIGTSMLNGDCGMSAFGALGGSPTRVELHEDSAATALSFIRDSGLNANNVNPNGGTLAYSDPAGATGVRLIATLAHAISAGETQSGIALTAGSGGMTAGTLLQR